jgi:hypothetical protein
MQTQTITLETRRFVIFLREYKVIRSFNYAQTSGTLHLLFSYTWKTLAPELFVALFTTIHSLFKCYLICEVFLDRLI